MAVTEQQPKSCSVNDTSSINETHESSTAEVSSENAQRILVAEDSPVTQDLLKLVLEERGHHVEVVADGEAALAELKVNTYDVVLMDFHLPKMDGL
ncbi:MAG: response regulator, partial [candidate division Zixibacteria bacterium]